MPRLTNDTDYPLDAALTGAEKVVFVEGTDIKKATLDDVSDAAARRLGIYNVLDYGAVGDGVTDDTAAIQAAIDAAEAAAPSITRIPDGGAFLVDTLTVSDNVTIEGPGTIKKATTSASALHITGDNVTVSGVTFAAASDSGQPNSDIKLGDGSANVVIDGCTFKSPIYSAIAAATDTDSGGSAYAAPVSGLTIANCRFVSGTGNYTRPIYLHSVENITITGNIIRDCDFDGIRLRENDGYCVITNNQFIDVGDPTWPDSQTRDAIDTFWAGQRLTIANNIIRNAAYQGLDIKLANSDGTKRSEMIVVTGNQISGCRYSGILLGGDDDYDGAGSYKFLAGAVIANNVIEQCNQENSDGTGTVADAGIRLKGLVCFATISDNIVKGNYGRGIYVHNATAGKAACHDIRISGNQVVNNGYSGQTTEGIIATGTSYVQIDGNICVNDTSEANPFQSIGIYTSSSADGFSYTPVAKSINITDNICKDNLTRQIQTDANGSRADAINQYFNNIESGTGTPFRGAWQYSRSLMWGASAPTSAEGTFRKGDVVINVATAVGGIIGWICTTAGTPGTWTPMYGAGTQRVHVADPSGGATIDAEARTAINSILVSLETFGFHASA